MTKYKTIAVSPSNYLILKDLGKTGDSFNDVLTPILKSASKQKMEQSKMTNSRKDAKKKWVTKGNKKLKDALKK